MNKLLKSVLLLAASFAPAVGAFAQSNTVQFDPATYQVKESDGQVVLTVTLSRFGDPSQVVTVNFATRDDTAAAGSDYDQRSGTITFNAGETQKTLPPIPIRDDVIIENTEQFFVDLSNPNNASLGSNSTATVTIKDDDSVSTVQFSSSSYSVSEGGGAATLIVTRTGGMGLYATANYSSSNGTATAGSDYNSVSGSVTFAPGESQKTITVPIIDDSQQESSETFQVTLQAGSNATVGSPNSATVTIIDNDAGSTVQFSPTNYVVNEASGVAVLTVIANRADPNATITVAYATRQGTATADQDYTSVSGTLTFNAGDTQKQIAVPINNDSVAESSETFYVDLSNPTNASLTSDGSSTANVVIADDDSGSSTLTFNPSSYSVNEAAGSVTLTVVRSGELGRPVSVSYSTNDGTAIAGADYTAKSGMLTFSAGQTQQTINVAITDDASEEGSEYFTVQLSNPSAGASVGQDSTATVTIVDNDGAVSTVEFSPKDYTVKETPGNTTVTLGVIATRFGDPATVITVNYFTSDGSAHAGSDYKAASGTVTFGPGETRKEITVTILDDNLIENAENFFVTLTNPNGAAIGGNSQATVTIADDDSPTASIGFSSSSYDVDEGAGAAVLTVTRSGGLSFSATVNYQTHDGQGTNAAVAGTNYTATSGTLTFAPGETSKTISIPIIDEGSADPTLQFTVTLSDPNGTGFVGGQSTATVNILDNDANTFRFSSSNYTVNEGAGSATLTVVVQRSGDPSQSISVDYVTTDGTAQDGQKYVRTAGRLTFDANVTSQTITVPIIDEPYIEGNTYFNVVLSNPLPAKSESGNAKSRVGSPSMATVTIIDNDARSFQFTSSTYTVANSSGTAYVTVTFNRATEVSGTYTVDYFTQDDTAVAGKDYTPSSGRLTFAPGETSKTFPIQITQQGAGQPTRDFQVRLANPSNGAVLGSPAVATVVITNPDFSTKLLNISTRGPLGGGDDLMIGGFIVQGDSSKTLVLRAIGPSMSAFGVAAVSDPNLTLTDANGTAIAFNDDYVTASFSEQQLLSDIGLTPDDERESAIVTTVGPGNYTALLRATSNGAALVEVYDITSTISTKLVNISTRGKVEHGDSGAMIAGFIVGAPGSQPGVPQRVIIRAIGPSLKQRGVTDSLADTTLDIYSGGRKILSNDDWKSNSAQDQQALQAAGIPPTNDKESAIITTLDPGSYSAVIRGKNDTIGVALAEVYQIAQ